MSLFIYEHGTYEMITCFPLTATSGNVNVNEVSSIEQVIQEVFLSGCTVGREAKGD